GRKLTPAYRFSANSRTWNEKNEHSRQPHSAGWTDRRHHFDRGILFLSAAQRPAPLWRRRRAYQHCPPRFRLANSGVAATGDRLAPASASADAAVSHAAVALAIGSWWVDSFAVRVRSERDRSFSAGPRPSRVFRGRKCCRDPFYAVACRTDLCVQSEFDVFADHGHDRADLSGFFHLGTGFLLPGSGLLSLRRPKEHPDLASAMRTLCRRCLPHPLRRLVPGCNIDHRDFCPSLTSKLCRAALRRKEIRAVGCRSTSLVARLQRRCLRESFGIRQRPIFCKSYRAKNCCSRNTSPPWNRQLAGGISLFFQSRRVERGSRQNASLLGLYSSFWHRRCPVVPKEILAPAFVLGTRSLVHAFHRLQRRPDVCSHLVAVLALQRSLWHRDAARVCDIHCCRSLWPDSVRREHKNKIGDRNRVRRVVCGKLRTSLAGWTGQLSGSSDQLPISHCP